MKNEDNLKFTVILAANHKRQWSHKQKIKNTNNIGTYTANLNHAYSTTSDTLSAQKEAGRSECIYCN